MEENSKILIAADNELFYPSCITYFEGLGISVEHKDDGLAALNCVKTEKYEFIIAETQLAYLGGLHLCKIVKSDSRFKHIPFVLVLESGDSQEMLNARRVQADYSLTMPVDLDILRDNVINLLYNQKEKEGVADAT
jgi:CheY-like chemotaxis protein|tara:strand:+ start:6066 stop:6473 length:408 start_codon:yes stop_codon:yes gene_type:complete